MGSGDCCGPPEPSWCNGVDDLLTGTKAQKEAIISANSCPVIKSAFSGDSLSFDPTFQARVTGGTWHTCTCKDGTDYECQSNKGDGAACCGRSMPALCGEGNVPDKRSDEFPITLTGDALNFGNTDVQARLTGWHTCTCKDGTDYECQSNRGDGAGCCDRSMPALCGEGNVPDSRSVTYQSGDALNFDFADAALRVTGGTWHTCTCKDGTDYSCQSNKGDGAACCGRSMPALCGEGNVPDSRSVALDLAGDAINFENDVQARMTGWHTCTCKDGTDYECQSNKGDGAACCGRSMPALCGEGNVPDSRSVASDLAGDAISFDSGDTILARLTGWHTCTCKDGTDYECQSNRGDGAGCCDRSMPALCGEGNVPDSVAASNSQQSA
jgi:hypothetical protein